MHHHLLLAIAFLVGEDHFDSFYVLSMLLEGR